MKVYCEPGALTADVRALQRKGCIELVHFPVDPDARTRHIAPTAIPSEVQWSDLNLSWAELNVAWEDMSGSEHLSEIRALIGPSHRRDILHVDSAYKTGCHAFLTVETDILKHRDALSSLLGIAFFDPNREAEAFSAYVESRGSAV